MILMLRKWISAPSDCRPQESLLLRGAAGTIDERAVHRELENAVNGDHGVGVPLPSSSCPVLDRHAAGTPGIVRYEFHAANANELAVNERDRRRRTAFREA